jgi:hypothetical protein
MTIIAFIDGSTELAFTEDRAAASRLTLACPYVEVATHCALTLP